ncbi:putative intron-encoded endonuclease [Lachnellula suecica]|uniref:Putative intron-encoded endonuclease n=1 Tax=Lachnellula suecica TaxID=602035 RepID=A0A8T9C4P9_9HELO|nr:putative intron-encoded endonuclease [Lachnellula suecica]
MYLAIITLPLLGSIVSGFFGRKVGVSGAQIITCTSVIVTTLLAIVAFFEVGYMSHDPHNQRFFSYLSLFTFMMIILVTANNFLLIFGNIDYATVFSLAPFVNENIVTIIGICLLIGAMAKSSQVGLHV